MNKTAYFIAITVVIFNATAFAEDQYCFEQASAKYGVPSDLIKTISQQESAHNPNAINYNMNGTYDFGHMQINSSHVKVIGLENWMTLGDPCSNTMWGTWILAGCIHRHGYNWKAIGCYNAGSKPDNEWNRKRYAWKIYSAMNKAKNKQKVTVVQNKQKTPDQGKERKYY